MARIIIVNRYFFPDVSATSQIVSDLAFYLAESGWEVCVITSRLHYEDTRVRFPSSERLRGVRIRRVWSSASGGTGLTGRMAAYLSFFVTSFYALLAEATRGDVILATTDPPMISVVGGLVAQIRSAKHVNWLQDVFPEVAVALKVKGLVPPIVSVLTQLRNWSLRRAEENVAIGQVMAAKIGSISGVRSTTVISNWALESSDDATQVASDDMRRAWGLAGAFVVGYSGNLGRAHSWELLFGAAKRLSHRKDIMFLFIGGGTGMRELERNTAALGLDNVTFLGYQPRETLRQSLRVPHLHIVSLKPDLEGLIVPSKFYGVLAAERPVVFVGLPEGEVGSVIRAAACGVAVEEGDLDAFIHALTSLAAEPARACEMGRAGRAYLDAHYGRERALAKWYSTLQCAAGDGARGNPLRKRLE